MHCYLKKFLSSMILSVVLFCASMASGKESVMLPKNIQSVLKHRNLNPSSLSVLIVDLENEDIILSWNSKVPRTPASVMKLFTTAIALDALGPTYKWKTAFYVKGDLNDGVLSGDLLIKGYGDPYLTTENVWKMLNRLKVEGVKKITGNLLVDDSYFLNPSYDPGEFDNEPLRSYNVGPNALMFNFRSVRFFVESSIEDEYIKIKQDPLLPNFRFSNNLKSVVSKCVGYQKGIQISSSQKKEKFVFSGTFPDSCQDYSLFRSVLSHNEYSYGLFQSIWKSIGGEFDGVWAKAIGDELLEPFFVHESDSLSYLISKINKNSNNAMSRNLLLTLAAEKISAPGDIIKGQKFIYSWLEEKNFSTDGFYIENGSGLSRIATVSADQIIHLLKYAYASDFMPEFLSSLAISGLDGTMSDRNEIDELTGKLHIKTGSIDHVSSVAGYIHSKSGKRYGLAIIHNERDIHKGFGEELQDSIMQWLYNYEH